MHDFTYDYTQLYKFTHSSTQLCMVRCCFSKVLCMYTNVGGHGLFGFGHIATFQKQPNFPFGP